IMTIMEMLKNISDKLDLVVGILSNLQPQSQDSERTIFEDFARYYFDKFRWRKVSPETKVRDLRRYNRHIAPAFGTLQIDRITPQHCQRLIDNLSEKPKTAHEILSLLNVIFKAAIKHKLVGDNPCDMIYISEYEQQHGRALTKDEECRLLAATSGTRYQKMFAVILYTGLRPNEYKTVEFDGAFIVAKNSKQKDGKEHKKKIPITPMLAPYLADMSNDELRNFKFHHVNRLRDKFKLVLPEHKLYDMRTTFYTRCQECGVSDIARNLFVGHSLGGLADTYSDISDEYLISEARKIVY
ncbi:MAG: hypothetical protein OSJ74_11850, partial [Clostridia bacterium]|nr:hypothetical protein [Clostridia bacterium]